MTSTMKTEEVLHSLQRQVTVPVYSTRELVGKVEEAAADKERERKETFQKRQEEGKTKQGDTYEPLRRKPGLRPLPGRELGLTVRLSFWDVLHHLGRGLALSQRGASRGLAEHWGALKYCQALSADAGTHLTVSDEGKRIAIYYKALQSEELGHAFALAISEEILTRRYPDHSVSIVRADTALRPGWTLTSRDKAKTKTVGYHYRPQFFAEVWKPGESSRVFPIACKGNHSDRQKAYEQLASAAVHADGVHIGAWNETPALLFSTEISLSDLLTVHALHADGPGGWLHIPDGTPTAHIGQPVGDKNPGIGIFKPGKGKDPDSSEPGCQVGREDYEWFQRALAHVGAAGLTAFAGDGESTAALLTTRQGSDFFQGFTHAAAGTVQDARYTLLGEKFEGTDHVFRLNGERVQAFSGVATDILDVLVTRKEPARHADVAAYRQRVHARKASGAGRSGTASGAAWSRSVGTARCWPCVKSRRSWTNKGKRQCAAANFDLAGHQNRPLPTAWPGNEIPAHQKPFPFHQSHHGGDCEQAATGPLSAAYDAKPAGPSTEPARERSPGMTTGAHRSAPNQHRHHVRASRCRTDPFLT